MGLFLLFFYTASLVVLRSVYGLIWQTFFLYPAALMIEGNELVFLCKGVRDYPEFRIRIE